MCLSSVVDKVKKRRNILTGAAAFCHLLSKRQIYSVKVLLLQWIHYDNTMLFCGCIGQHLHERTMYRPYLACQK